MPSTPEDRLDRLLTLGPRLYDLKEPSGRATSLVDALLARAPAGDGAAHRVDKLLEAAGEDSDAMIKTAPADNLPQLDDAIDHWREARERVDARRVALADAQLAVRGAASLEEGEVAAEALAAAAAARNEARVSLIDELDEALALNKRWDAEGQRGRLQAEAARLADAPGALGAALTRRLRLERLQAQMLPALDEWVEKVPGWRAERDELGTHAAKAQALCDTTKLHELDDTCEEADKALKAALEAADGRRPPPGAAAAVADAQRAAQRAESAFRRERARLARLASSHFPELLAREPLLLLGAAEGPAFQRVLVERRLESYTGPSGRLALEELANHLNARHRVLRCEYVGESAGESPPEPESCVLKEYDLDEEGKEWKKLVTEVTLLARLSHPHIVNVQAVFQQVDPRTRLNVAYVQLPYFANGDAARWLDECDRPPPLDVKKRVLHQLAQALHHLHAHGYAHGDIKLQNVLISADQTAHLADFESVREESSAASRTRTRTTARSGAVATRKYEAPELRSRTMSKATAASDMYSHGKHAETYGVCCLLLCCAEAEDCEFDAETEALKRWDRTAAAAKGGEHLPSLLDELLDLQQPPAANAAEAVRRRISAREALCRPFLDPAAEREQARLKTEAAAASAHEAAEQLKAVERAAARKQREAEGREAELRRQQDEQEELLKRAVQEQRRLKGQQDALQLQEMAANKAVTEAAKAEAKAEKAEAKEEKARQATKEQAAKLKAEKEKVAVKEAQAKEAVEKNEKLLNEIKSKEKALAQQRAAGSLPMIYLSSSGKHLPDIEHAIKAYLQDKVESGGKVSILELNDANPIKDPWADQPIYQRVKQTVKDLGYTTNATPYQFFEFQKVMGTKLDDLLEKLARPGTICIVVGGNTWRLSYAFSQMRGLRATISKQVQCGDLMYVSFSAGTVMAGRTVEINTDKLDDVKAAGGSRANDGFCLVDFALRPHNQMPHSQAAGKEFEKKLAAKKVKDDDGNTISDCPVLYLEDGEACLFAGTGRIKLPNSNANDAIAQLRSFLSDKGNGASASWSRPAQMISADISLREIKAVDMGSTHTKELFEFNFALGQYTRLLGTASKPVKQVDVYESKAVKAAYASTKAQFAARGLKDAMWVFHGTPSSAVVRKICCEGFKVAGQPGGPPIAHGAVHGHGVYSAKGPGTPMGYGQGSNSVILCLALPGKKGAQGVGDSWYPNGDWVIFKTGPQLLPKYVVHF